jgi:hypothetical protein
MTASQKESTFTQRTLLALLTAHADRAELDETIGVLTRSLADAHGIPRPTPTERHIVR